MRKFKSVLAFVLALVLVLSCLGNAFALDGGKTAVSGKATVDALDGAKEVRNEQVAKTDKLKGFKSEKFQLENTYKYADDEIVRAIIILKDAPAADVAERGSTKAANYSVQLAKKHEAVRNAMKGVNFEMKYDFTTLINGMSGDVAYGDLDKIAALDGVEAVYIANHYAEPVLEPATAGSGELTGNTAAGQYWGLMGEGMVIAVLDTGLRTSHEAFQPTSILGDVALTEESVELASASGVYVNAKVPFAYDYGDQDADVSDKNGHGTHVSGIAAGCKVEDDGAITFAGAAPAAQILAMKIFMDRQNGTSSDIYFAAIEDAYKLGADVVNMSIGSQNGFTYDDELESEVFGNIYQRMADAGVVMCVAAGNEGSQADNAMTFVGPGYVTADYADYGVVGSPSTYDGNVSVASVDNAYFPSYVITVNGKDFAFTDSSDDGLWMKKFAGQTVAYVVVPNTGDVADYEGLDVEGKIAVVTRGDITFEEKMVNAANAGAVGCIVVNNQPGVISMAIEDFKVPAISVQQDAAAAFAAAKPMELTTPSDMVTVDNPTAILMSDFSSWGADPMLTLKPTITSVGGSVYSALPNSDNSYDLMSGTSMATPNAAGTFANVLQALKEDGVTDKKERADLAKSLLESTGVILEDADGAVYSVRKQGTGLANTVYALATLWTGAYITNPLVELGDDKDKTGVYSFDVELRNDTDNDVLYDWIEAYVLRDVVARTQPSEQYPNGKAYNTLTSEEIYPNVTCTVNGQSVEEVTVPANGTLTVSVKIELTAEQKAEMDEDFENGGFIEGYVSFYNVYEDDGELYIDNEAHSTFLAFYGDWTKGEVLDKYDFRDVAEAETWLNTTAADEEGNTYADHGYTVYDVLETNIDFNLAALCDSFSGQMYTYAGDHLFEYVEYNEKHIAFTTPETDGTYYYGDGLIMVPSLLRNARHLVMTVTDKQTGEVYYVDDTEYLPKAAYDTEEGYWQNFASFTWDGTDKDGNYVPSGTVATISFDAVLPYGDTLQKNVWSFDATVDYTAPKLEAKYDKASETITVTASDENYLQAIYLEDSQYKILDSVSFSDDEAGKSHTVTFDVSDYDLSYVGVVAIDYASNEMEENIYLIDEGAPATVTFVTANGETVVDAKIAETLTLPDAGNACDGFEFVCWVNKEYVESDGSDIDVTYDAGEQVLVTASEMKFYALYAKGEMVYYNPAEYYAPANYPTDFTGDWAFVGFPYDGKFNPADPYTLGNDLTTVRVNDLNDATIDTQYLEFVTNADVSWHFNMVSKNVYTIQSNKTGEFLTLVDGKLALTDGATTASQWYVLFNSNVWFEIVNASDMNSTLLFDDTTSHEFGIYDYSEFGNHLISMYKCVKEEFVVDYFTTKVDCPSSEFSDVLANVWYHSSIDYMVENGLMNGMGDGTFGVEGTLTRGQIVTILYRMAGSPSVEGKSHPFTDVLSNNWYTNAIIWGAETGIVKGMTATTFEPDRAVSREQIATFLFRYADATAVEEDCTSAYPDAAQVSDWAKDALNWVIANGILNGVTENDGETYLEPQNNATRAQAATLLARLLNK